MAETKEAAKAVATFVVMCKWCEKQVNALVEGEYSHYFDEVGEPMGWTLLRCPKCNQPMLSVQDYYDDGEEWTAGDPRIVYPESYKKLDHNVPEAIRKSYDEAVTCFGVRAYTASAIMCRRTLEAVVEEKIPKKQPLATGIKALQKQGLIDPQLVEWAEMLRVSGNKAAHEVGQNISKQDAGDTIDFTHALVEYLFTYKQKFEQFKERAKKPAKPDRAMLDIPG